METPIIETKNLEVCYSTERRTIHAVRDVSLSIQPGQTLGIVGESGSGKSTLAYAVMGHCGANGEITGGKILFHGNDLSTIPRRERLDILGNRIAMVYQDPQKSLNPSLRIGEQIAEVLRRHKKLSRHDAKTRTIEILEAVHLPDPEGIFSCYPHQLSGGMQQRVVIALALVCNPDLLIMDEPTSGLDVTTEAVILDLISELKSKFRSSIMFITHNLGVIARICDHVAVMYAGEIVEINSLDSIFKQQTHPYTLDLLSCIPKIGLHHTAQRLKSIPGQLPRSGEQMSGCIFEPRCSFSKEKCSKERPPLKEIGPGHYSACFYYDNLELKRQTRETLPELDSETEEPVSERLLTINKLKKTFGSTSRRFIFFGPRVGRQVNAVSDVSLNLSSNETLAIVGESGCGKTTLAHCICGLEEPTSGNILFRNIDITKSAKKRDLLTRREMQIVFQNPDSSLNPQHTIAHIVGRPLKLFHRAKNKDIRKQVIELLELVRLDASYLDRFPAELSGGEKQRVSIARAFAGNPSVVVCDEAVSSLDVSVQASILNLLVRLQVEKGASYLFISHDLSVIQYIADRIHVMYLGHLMETGTVEQIVAPPYHPYTEALLSAIPLPDPTIKQKRIRLEGPVTPSTDNEEGCPFHNRCPRYIGDICKTKYPQRQETNEGHWLLCHIPLEELKDIPSVMTTMTYPHRNEPF